VVVERAAQPLPAAMGGEPMPVWHVYVLGARLRLQGDAWREADVAEICLQPLCRLPEVIAEAAIVAQAEQDFGAALTELSDELARRPMGDAELDNLLEQAAEVVLGPRQWPTVRPSSDLGPTSRARPL